MVKVCLDAPNPGDEPVAIDVDREGGQDRHLAILTGDDPRERFTTFERATITGGRNGRRPEKSEGIGNRRARHELEHEQ